jgi:hypothetical protein
MLRRCTANLHHQSCASEWVQSDCAIGTVKCLTALEELNELRLKQLSLGYLSLKTCYANYSVEGRNAIKYDQSVNA